MINKKLFLLILFFPILSFSQVKIDSTEYCCIYSYGHDFIIKEKATENIIAFGESVCDTLLDNIKYWLGRYKPSFLYRGIKNNIEPIINTKWGQSYPFNIYCPLSENGDTCKVGCVAVALGQMLYYFKYPLYTNGVAVSYYVGEKLTNEFLKPIELNWEAMFLEYTGKEAREKINNVAKLLEYVGKSVRMHYGVKSSGAVPRHIVSSFECMFGYYYGGNFITDLSSMEDSIYNELKKGMPVIIGGVSEVGGHEFIIDGYKDGYFHINWGWYGKYDGYYDLSYLNPNETYVPTEIIIGILPVNSGVRIIRLDEYDGVFDLIGRRSKGGIYIKNGKKYIKK